MAQSPDLLEELKKKNQKNQKFDVQFSICILVSLFQGTGPG